MSKDGAISRRKSGGDSSDSRIPLPHPRAAPGTFRRSSSMRLRGEKVLQPPRGAPFPVITETDGGELWRGGGGTPGPWPGRALGSRHRSLSLSGSYPQTPTPSPDEDDADSLQSFGSGCSAMSCDHVYFARNGTTFSGRRMKYVVHCSPHGGETDEYLTPTQRANRQIRRLKILLQQTQKDLEQKDQDIFRLTKEVVELRLFKASLSVSSPDRDEADGEVARDERDAEGERKEGTSPLPPQEAQHLKVVDAKTSSPSLADSGHFEDMAASSTPEPMLEKRLQDMQHNHMQECQELKERHNDRMESLLQRLSDVNNRYCELRSDYDRAQDKIRQLERETESLRKSMEEHDDRHKNMYLKMYMKGQEAARFEHADQVLEFAHQAPGRVSVPELLQQLQVTENELENIKDTDEQQTDAPKCALLSAKEAVSLWLLGTRKAMYRRIVESRAKQGELDPEITLQFLKSAIYYFLTDKENHQGHLNAIESILGYTENEKLNIEKAYRLNPRK